MKYNLIVSYNAPSCRDVLWAKPEKDGFNLYLLDNGAWKPLKAENIKNSEVVIDESMMQKLIGSVQDKKSANTINGAKAYAKDVRNTIVGSKSDTEKDLTLCGLKAYIDARIAELK